MPLPRFHRLPADRRRKILDVATARLAADGVDTASYNQILSEAAVPKASAYHYFDGRADLVDTVLLDVAAQLFGALGSWEYRPTPGEFRAAIAAGGGRMTAHLMAHPDHRALAPAVVRLEASHPGPRAWVSEVVDNGRAIAVIRTDLPRDLLVAATLAVLQTIDSWAISEINARMDTGAESPGSAAADPPTFDPSSAFSLVEGLWRSPKTTS